MELPIVSYGKERAPDMVRQIIGVILMVIAAIVAIHTIVEPLYHTSTEASPYSPLWNYIDPLSALAVVTGLALSFLHKRRVDSEGGVTWDRLATSTLFYGFIFVGISFFLSWFNLHSPRYTAIGPDAAAVIWLISDSLLPILAGSMGMRVFKGVGG